ncbi:MAG: SEC-C domain-containing protein [Planctomycetaceae bacterium]|jgi:preprotein translocase subunit SecA|nr:SEC-C domain-containing protein [Planctomycetaceae bacterium]
MEFERIFDSIGDFFNALTRSIESNITSLFGSSNARYIKRLQPKVDAINALEAGLQQLSNDELKGKTAEFRQRLAGGETLDDILTEAFAVCRETSQRVLGLRHYDVQLMGGMVLHSGAIAEMMTGEGKTLVATLPAYLNALEGKGVHVVTVNDYLARRDMEWMGPLYLALGISVGTIQSNMPADERQKAYQCDITYGTNNEFGFDYLRDNMKFAAKGDDRYPPQYQQVQGRLNFAVIDEVDNILIDEARTPLIIAGPAHDDVTRYSLADKIARQLKKDEDFEVKEKEHTANLTDAGVRHAEKLVGVESFYTAGNMEWPHLIDNALKAHFLYKKDVNYMIQGDEIVIVDEFTGRAMPGRNWSDGLHQAVEAKEGVRVKEENQTLATITLQNFFKLYDKISGMTGTGMTEASEFWKIYKLDVIAMPTNKPLRRLNFPDAIYRTEREKYNAIVQEIERLHKWDVAELGGDKEIWGNIINETQDRIEMIPKGSKEPDFLDRKKVKAVSHKGRPILVGTVSIEKSELISRMLDMKGIKHQVLNAKHHEREAEIVAQAGRKGAVTIATNMAGRGTDIILGGNPEAMAWSILQTQYPTRLEVPRDVWITLVNEIEAKEQMKPDGDFVRKLGGLHIIGTERHEARRIDLQLRGRTGRQGDPGSSRFFLSLEDDLMRIFAGEWVKRIMTMLGMEEGQVIESRMVSRRIEGAQRKVEERNFDVRKNLLEYDEVMDFQRKSVYGYRQRILDGANCKELIFEMIDEQVDKHLGEFLDKDYEAASFAAWSGARLNTEFETRDFRGLDFNAAQLFAVEQAKRMAESYVLDQIEENMPADAEESEWNWQALAHWSNATWHTGYSDRDLKKIPRDELAEVLIAKAHKYIDSVDLSGGAELLAAHYGVKTAAGWIKQKFDITLNLDEMTDWEADKLRAGVQQLTHEKYREKEIQFPVLGGLIHFTIRDQNGQRYDREGLVEWAKRRFDVDLLLDDLKSKQRQEIAETMFEQSRIASQHTVEIFAELRRRYEELLRSNGIVPETLRKELAEQQTSKAGLGQISAGSKFAARSVAKTQTKYTGKYATTKSSSIKEKTKPKYVLRNDKAAEDFTVWFNETLYAGKNTGRELTVQKLAAWEPEELEDRLASLVEDCYNPEMRQMERSLVLQILDTLWKDHLLVMDHLRSSIGLRGYAQVDPKVEYKREGMKLFTLMWSTVYSRVTDLIFRMEQLDPGFVTQTWQETETHHEEAGSVLSEMTRSQRDDADAANAAGTSDKKIEPIRRKGPAYKGPAVGRNDLCPCGSGKKYKACCGKQAAGNR